MSLQLKLKATTAMSSKFVCVINSADNEVTHYPPDTRFGGGNKDSREVLTRNSSNTLQIEIPSGSKYPTVIVGFFPTSKCRCFANVKLNDSIYGNCLVEADMDSYEIGSKKIRIFDPSGKITDSKMVNISQYNWLTISFYNANLDDSLNMFNRWIELYVCDKEYLHIYMENVKYSSAIGCEPSVYNLINQLVGKMPDWMLPNGYWELKRAGLKFDRGFYFDTNNSLNL